MRLWWAVRFLYPHAAVADSGQENKKGLLLRRLKVLCAGGAVFLVALVAFGVWTKERSDAHYFEGYERALPLEVLVEGTEVFESHIMTRFSFIGVEDERVPALLALPRGVTEAVPCIIFLHGIGQSKDFLSRIVGRFVEADFAMATFDQYTRGERKDAGGNFFQEAQALRRRGTLTVLETRRMIDYLESRKEIDAERIYLIGASYGAIMGSIAAAFDERIKGSVFTYGGADFGKLFHSREARNSLGVFAYPGASFVGWFLEPGDPLSYVGRISPRPVLFQNGRLDGLIPVEAAEAFQDAAREPKEVVWYDSDHIGLDEDHVEIVLQASLEWLLELDGMVGRK